MKKLLLSISLLTLLLPFAGGSSGLAANAQTYIDSMVRDNINLRRREDVYKSREKGKSAGKSRRNSAAAKNSRSATVVNKPEPAGATVHFGMDLYNYFAEEDPEGFTVKFTFTSIDGGVFTKSYKYNTSRNETNAPLEGIPADHYTVTAQAIYRGRSHDVLLATEIGEPTNPNGGNFARSIKIQVNGRESSPGNVYIRVLN